jgi:hypothetical protein
MVERLKHKGIERLNQLNTTRQLPVKIKLQTQHL